MHINVSTYNVLCSSFFQYYGCRDDAVSYKGSGPGIGFDGRHVRKGPTYVYVCSCRLSRVNHTSVF